jgi:hypothetical protein
MKQGLERLRENKLAVVGCAALVFALTALGLWTNDTASRTTKIERTVNTEVVQALCNQPFTTPCLRRAVNIVKTCLADPRCSDLLSLESTTVHEGGVVRLPESGGSERQGVIESPDSSRENGQVRGQPRGSPAPDQPGKSKGNSGDEERKPEPASSSPVAPSSTGGQTTAGPEAAQGSEGGLRPEAAGGGALPAAIETVEGILECVGALEVGCSVREIVGPGASGR